MQALVDAARRKESVLVAGIDPIPSRFPEELRALPEADPPCGSARASWRPWSLTPPP